MRANPTVPILEISTVARRRRPPCASPTAPCSAPRTIFEVAARESIPAARQVKLDQLGNAKGGVINQGVSIKVALMSFLVALSVSCFAVLASARIRRGWAEQAAVTPWAPPPAAAIDRD